MGKVNKLVSIAAAVFVAVVYSADIGLVVEPVYRHSFTADGSGIEILTAAEVAYEGKKININTAAVDELMLLPNIGRYRAVNIIEYREKYGDFISVEELAEVEGISNGILNKLRAYVTVE